MTNQLEFIQREIASWGEDYIFDLLDRGYEAIELVTDTGETKWSWIKGLTPAPKYAMVESGGIPGVSPVTTGIAPTG